jgi:hypothetical protein
LVSGGEPNKSIKSLPTDIGCMLGVDDGAGKNIFILNV